MATSDLKSIVEGYFEEEGLESHYWVSEKIQGSRIEIFIDSDEGISFDICKKISRKIEAVLDETKEYGETYTLEVSSPGVGSPLLLKRQYTKNIGRTIEVTYGEPEETIKGTLSKVDDDEIVVDVETVEKVEKKKKKVIKNNHISFEAIKKAKIKISF